MSKQDKIYSLLLLSIGLFIVGFIVGLFVSNGGQSKEADYTIKLHQTKVTITETKNGKQKQVSHKELNDYFINDNL